MSDNPIILKTGSVSIPLKRKTWREKTKSLLSFLGPAFIVSVAYIDPGNFATNISGGSNYNFKLLWVILWSNLTAIFLQTLSAKLGIVTGKDLATQCGQIFSRRINISLWIISLLTAIATYMAEFLGATLGFYLLFGIPLLWAGALTVTLTLGIVYLQRFGQHIVERAIVLFVAVIGISYLLEIFLAKPDWNSVVYHTLVPTLDTDSLYIAAGMLGATVMPHVIYLHSELVKSRRSGGDLQSMRHHYKMERFDIFLAMNIAFLVNSAMLIVAATVFFTQGISVDSIEEAHRSLAPLMGSLSSDAFGLALLASGLSSSTVGAMAGECMMKGFINLDIPLTLRRIVTIIPAMLMLWLGLNPMQILIFSQVSLSFALPAAIIPLLMITSNKAVMGEMVNHKVTRFVGWIIVALILTLNAVLIYLTLF